MKKHIDSKKLALSSETIRDLRNLDGDSLRGVAGGESITGTCTDCNTYTKHLKNYI
jgi:hypothetical protein